MSRLSECKLHWIPGNIQNITTKLCGGRDVPDWESQSLYLTDPTQDDHHETELLYTHKLPSLLAAAQLCT